MTFWNNSEKTAQPLTEKNFKKFIQEMKDRCNTFEPRTIVIYCTCPQCHIYFSGVIIESPFTIVECPHCDYKETLVKAMRNFFKSEGEINVNSKRNRNN